MRDVEARHIVALMEFMYAGEVNVAQAHLSAFLKTAESLKIRGLTDTSTENENQKEEDTLFLNPQPSKTTNNKHKLIKQVSSSSTVTSSQDISNTGNISSPPSKRQCKSESEVSRIKIKDDAMTVNPFALQEVQPKMELPDYLSDDDGRDDNNFYSSNEVTELPGEAIVV